MRCGLLWDWAIRMSWEKSVPRYSRSWILRFRLKSICFRNRRSSHRRCWHLPGFSTWTEVTILSFWLITSIHCQSITDQITHWIDSERAADLMHLDCALDTRLEIASWKFLFIRLKIILRSFCTTIDEDEALLKRPNKLSHTRKPIVELRLNEKRLLTAAIEYLGQRIDSWSCASYQ